MRTIFNWIKGILFGAWILIAIFATVCLLSYNKYSVSEFGDTTLLIIDEDINKNFKKGDLVIASKRAESEYKEDEQIFFYKGNPETTKQIGYGKIQSIEKNGSAEASFNMGKEENSTTEKVVGYDSVIGDGNGAVVYHYAGTVLSIIESRWGFMFAVILPTVFLAIYEIFNIVDEVKKNSRGNLKEELRREIEEEMALKEKEKNEKE